MKPSKNKTRRRKSKHDKYADTALYPPIKPLHAYRMKVSDLHTIAYWTYGNPKGKPVVYFHGGPGAGTNPDMARFFNPQKYYIVLIDQRGCGESTPLGELRENTTQDLIGDFERIRESLGIKKWQVFGGSWGSTISIAYTMQHPHRVTELIVRGIFLARRFETDWVQEPGGAEKFNLEGWRHYDEAVPENLLEKTHGSYLDAYGLLFRGHAGEKARDNALLMWSAWEASISNLIPESWDDIIRKYKKDKTYIPSSLIEHHYFAHDCFLPRGYFFEEKNLRRIRDIPTVIVQGRYDLVCPNVSARELHEFLPKASFTLTMAGHSGFEPENIRYLVAATDKFASR